MNWMSLQTLVKMKREKNKKKKQKIRKIRIYNRLIRMNLLKTVVLRKEILQNNEHIFLQIFRGKKWTQ